MSIRLSNNYKNWYVEIHEKWIFPDKKTATAELLLLSDHKEQYGQLKQSVRRKEK